MFRLRSLAAIALAGTALAACTGVPRGLAPVTGFEPDRYLGRWYEIVRLDHSFERGLSNVTATYTLRPDGSINVLNRGFDTRACAFDEQEGRATFIRGEDVASLAVTFFPPFAGGYHVIALDRADYGYAVVTGPTRGFFWILSRTPAMDEALLQRLIADAAAKGFATDRLIRVSHDEPAC